MRRCFQQHLSTTELCAVALSQIATIERRMRILDSNIIIPKMITLFHVQFFDMLKKKIYIKLRTK